MLLLVNNWHKKRITQSKDWRNFGNARYLKFALVLQEKALVFSQSEARKLCILVLKSGWWWPITFENLVIVLIKHGISDMASYGRFKRFSSYAERSDKRHQRHAYTQTSNECLPSPSWSVRAILELPCRTELPLVQSTWQWPLIKHSQV